MNVRLNSKDCNCSSNLTMLKRKNLSENGMQKAYNVDLLQTLTKALKVFSIKCT